MFLNIKRKTWIIILQKLVNIKQASISSLHSSPIRQYRGPVAGDCNSSYHCPLLLGSFVPSKTEKYGFDSDGLAMKHSGWYPGAKPQQVLF